jgi:nitrogen-specific signal transduction histidine kinase
VVVEHHKGTIDFASEPGKGTTFIVRLPMSNPQEVAGVDQREGLLMAQAADSAP